MSELVQVHLRQARGFLKAGDLPRAIELLQKAAALVGDDCKVQQQITYELCNVYELSGRPDLAAQCAERLTASQKADERSASSAPSKAETESLRYIYPRRRARRPVFYLDGFFSHLIVAVLSGLAVWLWMRQPAVSPSAVAPATQPMAGLLPALAARAAAASSENMKMPEEIAEYHEQILQDIKNLATRPAPGSPSK